MKILILGASGLTGSTLFSLIGEEHEVYGTYFSQSKQYDNDEKMFPLDIAKIDQLETILNRAIVYKYGQIYIQTIHPMSKLQNLLK